MKVREPGEPIFGIILYGWLFPRRATRVQSAVKYGHRLSVIAIGVE
jgi:hypothetical protein